MIATLIYLTGILAAFAVGVAAGVFFARRGEAERLDLALSLWESAGGLIRQQQVRDAYEYDEQSWTKAAEVLGVDVCDYRKEA